MKYPIIIIIFVALCCQSCYKTKTAQTLPSIADAQKTALSNAEISWVEQIAKVKKDSMRIVDSLVKMGLIPDTTSLLHKTNLIVALVEVNDHDFANVLAFRDVKNNPIIDLAFPFSANINIDPATGKAYVYYNEQNRAMIRLGVYQKIQNGGVPIGLSILGNHDNAGWSTFESLSDATAFARIVAYEVRTKNYVAVLADDEYSGSNLNADPASYYMAMSEIKRLLPDIYLCWFAFGGGFGSWNGKKMGDIADACFPNYGNDVDYGIGYNFPAKGCFYSTDGGIYFGEAERIKGYGGWMIYNLEGTDSHLMDDAALALKGKKVHVVEGSLNPQQYSFINGR